jgi:hypothetical protein
MKTKYKPSITTWTVVGIAVCANIAVTIGTVLLLTGYQLSMFASIMYGLLLMVCLLVYKVMPTNNVGDTLAKLRHPNKAKSLSNLFVVCLISWPALVMMLYKAYKYRDIVCVTVTFGEPDSICSIGLSKQNYEGTHDKGVSPEDIEECMILINDDYFFKNKEAVSFMLIKYDVPTILKSFGYLNGIKSEIVFFNVLRSNSCQLKKKASEELNMDYAEVTEDIVCQHINFT